MSTSTQILFSSPALHSLKREQLVKLCKKHSLKANGKNVDLIQRLRQHAQSLPKDSPLSVAARSEDTGPIPVQQVYTNEGDQGHQDAMQEENENIFFQRPRPSEQWEVVMDSIEEVEENSSQGTLSSQRTVNNGGSGEFGTGGSKGTVSTVGSSIRALANSLGLKRTLSKVSENTTSSKANITSQIPQVSQDDDLAQNSKPYSTLPVSTSLPQTDHFTLETGRPSLDESPLPGHALRPGIPAPFNARLSLGLGVPATPTRQNQPTTTIRLVSNPLVKQDNDTSYGPGENGTPQLKPFQTTFDITFGSPIPGNAFRFGFNQVASWPPRVDNGDAEMPGIYPKLTIDDLAPSAVAVPPQAQKMVVDEENYVQMPGSLSPATLAPQIKSAPFIFGSPNHRVSNSQFRDAASSVLKEMNARLRAEGVDEISTDIVNNLHPDRKNAPAEAREIKPIPTSKRGEITKNFDEAHEREFSKMEGIDGTLKRRQQRQNERLPEEDGKEKVVVGKKRKSSVLEADAPPKRPSAKPRASTTRVISTGRRSKVIPGAFGTDEEEEESIDESKAGKRIRINSESLTPEELKRKGEEETREIQLEKEKEAIKKKLEANRARRRSSAAARKSLGGPGGRKSIGRGGPRPSVLIKPKPKPSRFGFLASAKSIVQNVWNRGKVTNPPPPSNIPKPAPASKTEAQASTSKGGKVAPPAFVPNKKSALASAKPTTANADWSIAAVPSTTKLKMAKQSQGSVASSCSSRSRSPLPSFGDILTVTSTSSAGTESGKTLQSTGSRVSSVIGTGKSRGSTAAGVSSVGTRLLGIRTSNAGGGTVGSMGTKRIVAVASRTSSMGTAASSTSSTNVSNRLSSRLFAPTASSLAKVAYRSPIAGNSPTPSGSLSSTLSGDLKFENDANKKEKPKEKSALGSITNGPAITSPLRPGGIFSKPLMAPSQSAIPSPVKRSPTDVVGGDLSSNANTTISKTTAPMKRTLTGRKPRISRSKVIAKLASQRAASGSSVSSSRSSGSGTSVLKPRASGTTTAGGKTRSSLGVRVTRASYGSAGGLKGRASGGDGLTLAMSAKRRARQSEYARRRSSRVVNPTGSPGKETPMEVDSAM